MKGKEHKYLSEDLYYNDTYFALQAKSALVHANDAPGVEYKASNFKCRSICRHKAFFFSISLLGLCAPVSIVVFNFPSKGDVFGA